jgi:hypothetical protein
VAKESCIGGSPEQVATLIGDKNGQTGNDRTSKRRRAALSEIDPTVCVARAPRSSAKA